MNALPTHEPPECRYAFGLTEVEVRRFQEIVRRCCRVELTIEEAWARAIEVLALGRLLIEAKSARLDLPAKYRRGSNVSLLPS
jgi:hypothetical protein